MNPTAPVALGMSLLCPQELEHSGIEAAPSGATLSCSSPSWGCQEGISCPKGHFWNSLRSMPGALLSCSPSLTLWVSGGSARLGWGGGAGQGCKELLVNRLSSIILMQL